MDSPHKPPPYTPIMLHSPCLPDVQNPFSSRSPLRYLFTSSVSYPLSDYQHTLCPCIRDFIHSPDTQQNSEVVHMYTLNPRFLLLPPYHSHYHTYEQAPAMTHARPYTLKVQIILILTGDIIIPATLLPLCLICT